MNATLNLIELSPMYCAGFSTQFDKDCTSERTMDTIFPDGNPSFRDDNITTHDGNISFWGGYIKTARHRSVLL